MTGERSRAWHLLRRLRWAVVFREWPWRVPWQVVHYGCLPSEVKVTPRMRAHAMELVKHRERDTP